jgi:DnaJ-class molecular chaperone
MEYKDYYKILGVDKSADDKAIKQAYRRLARKHHPDVSKAKGTAERFKEINEAYAVLSDPEKRKRYDSLGPDWQRYAQAGAGPFEGFRVHFGGRGGDPGDLGGFSDFFRTIFGDLGGGGDLFTDFGQEFRRGRTAGPARGEDIEASLEVTLEEAYHGSRKSLDLDGRRLEVKIPAGVDTGSRVRVTGGGTSGHAGGGRGDLYLMVTVRPHPFFERKGDELHLELPLTVAEAALGAEVMVPTFKGTVSMKIPPETSSGKTFRLPGYGMPRLKGTGSGDQYVKVKVVLPTGLTDRERRLFEELKQLRADNPRAHLG